MRDLNRTWQAPAVLLCLSALLAVVPAAAQQAAEQPAQPSPQPLTPAAPPAAEIEPGVDTSAARPSVAPVPRAAPVRDAAQPTGRARDRVDLDATQITGNRELPRVLYIVPWKRSDLGDLTGKPINSLLDEVLAPVDRDVFKRETRYFDAVSTAPAAGPAGTGAAAAPTGAPAADGATPVGDSVRDSSQAPEPSGQ